MDPQQLNRIEQKLNSALRLFAAIESGVAKIMKQFDSLNANIAALQASAAQLNTLTQTAVSEIQNGTVDPAQMQTASDSVAAANALVAKANGALSAVLPQPTAPVTVPATPAA